MKVRRSFISFAFIFCSLGWTAHAESGFDGKWVGTETFAAIGKTNDREKALIPRPRQTVIIIADHGRSVGRLQYPCYGRYRNVRLEGRTLFFWANDCKFSVTLSGDGRNLVEEGKCSPVTMEVVGTGLANSGMHAPVTWLPLKMSGTFHRVK